MVLLRGGTGTRRGARWREVRVGRCVVCVCVVVALCSPTTPRLFLSLSLLIPSHPFVSRLSSFLFTLVDPTDHRAAAAGLPPIDSHDISELILGKLPLSAPRRELPIGDGPSLSNISSAPLCSSYDQGTLASQYDLEYSGDVRWWEHREGELSFPRGANCSTVTSLIVDDGAGMLWKLVTGT